MQTLCKESNRFQLIGTMQECRPSVAKYLTFLRGTINWFYGTYSDIFFKHWTLIQIKTLGRLCRPNTFTGYLFNIIQWQLWHKPGCHSSLSLNHESALERWQVLSREPEGKLKMILIEFSLQPEEKKIWKILELDIPGTLREGNGRCCPWDLTCPPEPPRGWGRLWWLLMVVGLVCLSRSGWVCCFVMAHLSPGVSNWGPACCFQYQNYRPMGTMWHQARGQLLRWSWPLPASSCDLRTVAVRALRIKWQLTTTALLAFYFLIWLAHL